MNVADTDTELPGLVDVLPSGFRALRSDLPGEEFQQSWTDKPVTVEPKLPRFPRTHMNTISVRT